MSVSRRMGFSAKGATIISSLGQTPQGPESEQNSSALKARITAGIVAAVITCFRAGTDERHETNLCHVSDRRSRGEPIARAGIRARSFPGARGAAEKSDRRESE